MLVGQLGGDRAIDGLGRGVQAFPEPARGHRQVDVERHVALAHHDDGQVRLRPRDHPRPDFQGGLEARRLADGVAVVHPAQQLTIEAAVVGDVAAAAQHDRRAGRFAGQRAGDQVVIGRAAGGQDRIVRIGQQAFRAQAVMEAQQAAQIGVDLDGVLAGVVAEDQALIAFDTVQRDTRQVVDQAGQEEALVQRADAAAAVGHAQLDQQARGRRVRGLGEDVGDAANALRAVDQHIDGAIGGGGGQVAQARDLGAADELVGEDQVGRAQVMTQLQLGHGGGRQAPGAAFDLPGQQLRAHGRLGVRGQLGARPIDIGLHDRQVVVDRRALQHRGREGDVAAKQGEAPLRQVAQGPHRTVQRDGLGSGRQGQGVEIGQRHRHGQACGIRAMHSISTLQSIIIGDCTQARAGGAAPK